MCSWAALYVGIRHVGGVHVALEQQAPWGRPPFGTLMQLCFGMAREAITFLLSNRAEKPVSRPPGSCCTLECASESEPISTTVPPPTSSSSRDTRASMIAVNSPLLLVWLSSFPKG